MFPINQVLVPIDFSDCSRAALDYATALGQRIDAELSVLHTVHIPLYLAPNPAALLADASLAIDSRAVEAAKEQLDSFLTECDVPTPIKNRSKVIFGTAASSILQELRDQNYDLVVMGSHGSTGFQQLGLGGTADKVLRQSPCPVITVGASASVAE